MMSDTLPTHKAPPVYDAASREAISLDKLQSALAALPQARMPLKHQFTPGLYIREIRCPKGTLIITKIHKSEHPFVMSAGKAAVWTREGGVKVLQAPYTGITKPGTRRLIYILEDVVWTTFHPTNETDIDEIERQIIEPHPITPMEAQEAQLLLQQGKLLLGD